MGPTIMHTPPFHNC